MENQNPTPNPPPPTENIPAQNPAIETPPQAYTAPQPATPPPSPKPFFSTKIILLIMLLLILLGVGGTYFSLNSKPKPLPAGRQANPISPTSVPTPTPDPTANWKTYTNTNYKYSFKYPSGYLLTSDNPDSVFLSSAENKITFAAGSVEIPLPDSNCDKSKNFNLGGKKTLYSKCTSNTDSSGIIAVGGNNGDKYDNVPVLVIYNFKGIPEENIFNQILSTFKFTEASPTPTCRPRPACLDATPRCLLPETSDMCRPSITPPSGGGIVCTQDAKLCPDGKTYVGRQGPKCEFAACPRQ